MSEPDLDPPDDMFEDEEEEDPDVAMDNKEERKRLRLEEDNEWSTISQFYTPKTGEH